jgi:hypothetical protein
MPEFKSFARCKIQEYTRCLAERMPLFDSFGHPLSKIDLSFSTLSE